jgi:hypothetical protein
MLDNMSKMIILLHGEFLYQGTILNDDICDAIANKTSKYISVTYDATNTITGVTFNGELTAAQIETIASELCGIYTHTVGAGIIEDSLYTKYNTVKALSDDAVAIELATHVSAPFSTMLMHSMNTLPDTPNKADEQAAYDTWCDTYQLSTIGKLRAAIDWCRTVINAMPSKPTGYTELCGKINSGSVSFKLIKNGVEATGGVTETDYDYYYLFDVLNSNTSNEQIQSARNTFNDEFYYLSYKFSVLINGASPSQLMTYIGTLVTAVKDQMNKCIALKSATTTFNGITTPTDTEIGTYCNAITSFGTYADNDDILTNVKFIDKLLRLLAAVNRMSDEPVSMAISYGYTAGSWTVPVESPTGEYSTTAETIFTMARLDAVIATGKAKLKTAIAAIYGTLNTYITNVNRTVTVGGTSAVPTLITITGANYETESNKFIAICNTHFTANSAMRTSNTAILDKITLHATWVSKLTVVNKFWDASPTDANDGYLLSEFVSLKRTDSTVAISIMMYDYITLASGIFANIMAYCATTNAGYLSNSNTQYNETEVGIKQLYEAALFETTAPETASGSATATALANYANRQICIIDMHTRFVTICANYDAAKIINDNIVGTGKLYDVYDKLVDIVGATGVSAVNCKTYITTIATTVPANKITVESYVDINTGVNAPKLLADYAISHAIASVALYYNTETSTVLSDIKSEIDPADKLTASAINTSIVTNCGWDTYEVHAQNSTTTTMVRRLNSHTRKSSTDTTSVAYNYITLHDRVVAATTKYNLVATTPITTYVTNFNAIKALSKYSTITGNATWSAYKISDIATDVTTEYNKIKALMNTSLEQIRDICVELDDEISGIFSAIAGYTISDNDFTLNHQNIYVPAECQLIWKYNLMSFLSLISYSTDKQYVTSWVDADTTDMNTASSSTTVDSSFLNLANNLRGKINAAVNTGFTDAEAAFNLITGYYTTIHNSTNGYLTQIDAFDVTVNTTNNRLTDYIALLASAKAIYENSAAYITVATVSTGCDFYVKNKIITDINAKITGWRANYTLLYTYEYSSTGRVPTTGEPSKYDILVTDTVNVISAPGLKDVLKTDNVYNTTYTDKMTDIEAFITAATTGTVDRQIAFNSDILAMVRKIQDKMCYRINNLMRLCDGLYPLENVTYVANNGVLRYDFRTALPPDNNGTITDAVYDNIPATLLEITTTHTTKLTDLTGYVASISSYITEISNIISSTTNYDLTECYADELLYSPTRKYEGLLCTSSHTIDNTKTPPQVGLTTSYPNLTYQSNAITRDCGPYFALAYAKLTLTLALNFIGTVYERFAQYYRSRLIDSTTISLNTSDPLHGSAKSNLWKNMIIQYNRIIRQGTDNTYTNSTLTNWTRQIATYSNASGTVTWSNTDIPTPTWLELITLDMAFGYAAYRTIDDAAKATPESKISSMNAVNDALVRHDIYIDAFAVADGPLTSLRTIIGDLSDTDLESTSGKMTPMYYVKLFNTNFDSYYSTSSATYQQLTGIIDTNSSAFLTAFKQKSMVVKHNLLFTSMNDMLNKLNDCTVCFSDPINTPTSFKYIKNVYNNVYVTLINDGLAAATERLANIKSAIMGGTTFDTVVVNLILDTTTTTPTLQLMETNINSMLETLSNIDSIINKYLILVKNRGSGNATINVTSIDDIKSLVDLSGSTKTLIFDELALWIPRLTDFLKNMASYVLESGKGSTYATTRALSEITANKSATQAETREAIAAYGFSIMICEYIRKIRAYATESSKILTNLLAVSGSLEMGLTTTSLINFDQLVVPRLALFCDRMAQFAGVVGYYSRVDLTDWAGAMTGVATTKSDGFPDTWTNDTTGLIAVTTNIIPTFTLPMSALVPISMANVFKGAIVT